MTTGSASTDPRLDVLEDWIASQLGPVPNFKGVRYLTEYLRLFGDELRTHKAGQAGPSTPVVLRPTRRRSGPGPPDGGR